MPTPFSWRCLRSSLRSVTPPRLAMASVFRAALALLLVPRALGASLCMAAPPLGGSGRVQVQPCGPIAPEKWNVEMAGGTQTISQSAVDFCLDLNGGDTTNGNLVQVWECNGLANQQWVFADGTFQIQYYADKSKCVDAGSLKPGSKLQIWDCNGTPQQHWGYDSNQQTIYLSDSRRLRGNAELPAPAGFAV